MTIKIRIIEQLEKGAGTCRQLQDRSGFNLGTIRAIICELKAKGIVESREKYGRENVWVFTEDATEKMKDAL